jgi:hypothetical protein
MFKALSIVSIYISDCGWGLEAVDGRQVYREGNQRSAVRGRMSASARQNQTEEWNSSSSRHDDADNYEVGVQILLDRQCYSASSWLNISDSIIFHL